MRRRWGKVDDDPRRVDEDRRVSLSPFRDVMSTYDRYQDRRESTKAPSADDREALSLRVSPDKARFSPVLYANVSVAEGRVMSETAELAAYFVRRGRVQPFAGADEDRILRRLRAFARPD